MCCMKKILIIHSDMSIGGAETSLIALLESFNYNQVEVDLFLLNHSGELQKYIPKQVNLIDERRQYKSLSLPIKKVLFSKYWYIGVCRIFAKINTKIKSIYDKKFDIGYVLKQKSHYYCLPFLSKIKGTYDIGLSFIDPHYILCKKTDAKIKCGWLHTDYSVLSVASTFDYNMWNLNDFIIHVSEQCKNEFDKIYPTLISKSIVIENILPVSSIHERSNICLNHLINDNCINLLSIGRFSYAKNFDNIPEICQFLLDSGINVKWYIIGYGGDEQLIRDKIKEYNMEEHVIILGKKENPYPYIKACDIYIQPSRYEGKAVTIREAQILCKPVIITNYPTSKSQIDNGIDGVIVPMDNEKCAQGIIDFIKNKSLQQKIVQYLQEHDYSNADEVQKIYKLMGD